MCIDYTALGQRIKKVRKQKHFIQERLAEQLEVSTVYISQVENGKTKLSLEMLVRISNLLDTNPGYLLTGVSYDMQDYLKSDVAILLQDCSPKTRQLITDIVKLIANHNKM
ncbi:MAG: xre [Firmicutes bacterium]|nr:xre [Bacillota bacterium]